MNSANEMLEEHSLVGVVGAGTMGVSVTTALLLSGFSVAIVEVDPDVLDGFNDAVTAHIRMAVMLRPSLRRPDPSELNRRVELSTEYGALDGAEIVIENVTEVLDTKRRVYSALSNACDSDAIFGANTSCVSISWLGSLVSNPGRLIGTHFMNPVPLKDTVEVVRGEATTSATVERTGSWLAQMGKRQIVVGDAPGFVINRVLMIAINEAARVVEEGTSDATGVDRLFRECVGYQLGPLATADLIGLDTVVNSLDVLRSSFGDEKFKTCELLLAMVEKGNLGRKSGRGFHAYGHGESVHSK